MNQPPLGPLPNVDLTGRVVIVTGANTGLGFEAAKHIAKLNPAKLIMASRSKERGTAALKKLQEETGFSNAEVRELDQASFLSVRAFAFKFLHENERLDLILENAAIAPENYEVTGDGWDQSIQVNVLGPVYLTFLLLPIIQRTAAMSSSITPRITVVTSGGHAFSSLDEEALGALNTGLLKKLNEPEYSQKVFPLPKGKTEYSAMDHLIGYKTMVERRYFDMKLFNILFAQELQSRLSTSGIVVNSVDPGFCVSDLRRYITGDRAKAMLEAEGQIAYTAEEGGRTLAWALISGNGDDMKGKYVSCMEIKPTSEFSTSDTGKTLAKTLWNEFVQVLGEVDPRVKEIAGSLQ